MSDRVTKWKISTAVLAVALSAAACTSSGSSTSSTPSTSAAPISSSAPTSSSAPVSSTPATSPPPSSSAATAVDASSTPAATLRAGLDLLLRDHTNLTGHFVQTAVETGLTSKSTAASAAALDANSVTLSTAITSLYGAPAGAAFLKGWRAHIGYFVTYTKGLATGDKAMTTMGSDELVGYETTFGKFLGGATGLPASAVSADLKGHVDTLKVAIQALVTKDPSAADKMQMAAMHMDGTAAVLAAGIAKQKNLAGTVDGPASGLRAALTGLLIQHTAQTVFFVQTAVETGLTSKSTTAAAAALDANSVTLSTAITSLYGAPAGAAFLKGWRAHIGYFVTYTKGLATGDKAMTTMGANELVGYETTFGTFLGGATGLPASAVSADLKGHVDTLKVAIQAIVTKDPSAAAKIAMAEDHMAGTAAVLAKAIAAQKKLT